MKFLFLLSAFLSLAIASFTQEELTLKQRFQHAQTGSFIVIEQNKIYTLLHVYDKTEQSLILEEVSVPSSKISKRGFSWKQWFEQGAPGNTSWTMSEIDLQSGIALSAYSFTRQGWLDVSGTNSFMSTLLNLRFKPVPTSERKKIGTQPGFGKGDLRSFWNPKLVLNGQVVPGVEFSAWRTRWPNDGSELAKKIIEIYLPEENSYLGIDYPTYFPYWIEIEGKLGSAQVRVIDSGFDTLSPQPPMYKTY